MMPSRIQTSRTDERQRLGEHSLQGSVRLRLFPRWEFVHTVRDFVAAFCQATYARPDFTKRVRVVIQELLENAVKYAEHPHELVEVSIDAEDTEVAIAVTNRTSREHYAALVADQAMAATEGGEQFHAHAVARAAASPAGSSRLGLSRITFEGGFQLEVVPASDELLRVTVVARGKL